MTKIGRFVVVAAAAAALGKPARVCRAGEAWPESLGTHHRVSANASDAEPARLLAVLIVDAADEQLTIPDPQWKNRTKRHVPCRNA